MGLCVATTVGDQHRRGSSYDLVVRILDEQGTPYNVTSETLTLRLAHSYTDKHGLLEITGTPIDGPLVQFSFEPEHTENLSLGGYDMTILVNDYPVYHGRYGILPNNPEVSS